MFRWRDRKEYSWDCLYIRSELHHACVIPYQGESYDKSGILLISKKEERNKEKPDNFCCEK